MADIDVGTMLLTIDDVNRLAVSVSTYRDALLYTLSNERQWDRKDKLSAAINGTSDAYTSISNAYFSKFAEESVATAYQDRLSNACEEIKSIASTLADATSALVNATSALSNVAPFTSNVSPPNLSYATVASLFSRKYAIHPEQVSLDHCKPIAISSSTCVVICPSDAVKNQFTSVKDTKEKLLALLDPVELKLKTKRIYYTANNSIVLEADNINVDELRNCETLTDSGL